MKVVVSQPRYLPAPLVLERARAADVFVLLDVVQYTPRDWENRNRIRTARGLEWLSVPVSDHHRGQRILSTRVDNSRPWGRSHHDLVAQSYGAAPFAPEWLPWLHASIVNRSWDLLPDLNEFLFRHFLERSGISCRVVRASSLEVGGTGSDLVLDCCRRVGASRYISGPFGREYLDLTAFAAAGIDVVFHDPSERPWAQVHGGFEPRVSALDLFLNLGPQARTWIEDSPFVREMQS